MSRLSTNLYALSGTFEPYSEMEMRCLRYGDEARKLEDSIKTLRVELDGRPQVSPSVALRDPAQCPGDGCEGCGACLDPDADWAEAMKEAHESLDRLEDAGMERLAAGLESLGELDDRPRHVDIDGTRVHLLADEPPPIEPPSTRTFLPPKMDKIDD